MEVTEMATRKSSTAKAEQSVVFFEIPLELIIIQDQIRTRIDQAGEAFVALVESIREKGVLEPIIVTLQDGKYLLISGERRLLACRQLGMATIPARVFDTVTAKDEILALQLTENLQRAELDPIDTAMAMVGFFQIRHAEEGLDAKGIINEMILLEREPERVKKEVVGTVTTIQKITGKSITSLRRSFSLLKLPEEIQNAVREGLIGVSQGYILAANIDHLYLMDIFQQAVADGFTNDGLEKALKKGRPKVRSEIARKKPFSLFRRSVQSVRSSIEEQEDAFKKSDLEALLSDLHELIALVEGRLPEAIDDGAPAAEAPAEPKQKKPKVA
jgi:ParB-like chromosome segregation protein Spo0J